MNAKSNSIQILAEWNPDTITSSPPQRLRACESENSVGRGWAEILPLTGRAGENRCEQAMAAMSRDAFIAFRSGGITEIWEALVSLVLWLCGLLAISFCLL